MKPVAVTSELVINRDVHPPTSFLHNLSSSKAFPSIQVVSLPTLAAYLAEESAYKTASSVQQIYDIASELAVKSSIAPNNLIIWLKVYRLMQSVDFGMNHSRNRRLWASFANPIITPSTKTSEEVESNLRPKPIKPSKKTQKNVRSRI